MVWISNGSTDFTGRRLGVNQNKKTKSKLKSNRYSHFQAVSEAWLHVYSVLHKYFLQILHICTSWIFCWYFHGPSYRCTAVILPRCCYDVTNEGRIYPLVFKLHLFNIWTKVDRKINNSSQKFCPLVMIYGDLDIAFPQWLLLMVKKSKSPLSLEKLGSKYKLLVLYNFFFLLMISQISTQKHLIT